MDKFEVASQSLAKAQFQTSGSKVRQTKRSRIIRDGFSMPSSDYDLMSEIRSRLLKSGVPATKSSVLRAALHALNQLSMDDAIKIVEGLKTIKTGRPATTK